MYINNVELGVFRPGLQYGHFGVGYVMDPKNSWGILEFYIQSDYGGVETAVYIDDVTMISTGGNSGMRRSDYPSVELQIQLRYYKTEEVRWFRKVTEGD